MPVHEAMPLSRRCGTEDHIKVHSGKSTNPIAGPATWWQQMARAAAGSGDSAVSWRENVRKVYSRAPPHARCALRRGAAGADAAQLRANPSLAKEPPKSPQHFGHWPWWCRRRAHVRGRHSRGTAHLMHLAGPTAARGRWGRPQGPPGAWRPRWPAQATGTPPRTVRRAASGRQASQAVTSSRLQADDCLLIVVQGLEADYQQGQRPRSRTGRRAPAQAQPENGRTAGLGAAACRVQNLVYRSRGSRREAAAATCPQPQCLQKPDPAGGRRARRSDTRGKTEAGAEQSSRKPGRQRLFPGGSKNQRLRLGPRNTGRGPQAWQAAASRTQKVRNGRLTSNYSLSQAEA